MQAASVQSETRSTLMEIGESIAAIKPLHTKPRCAQLYEIRLKNAERIGTLNNPVVMAV